uniref:2,3-bisphosphoglycerate-dependent phosphoglycerate mutase n=1 Tax=uncultured Armatimonadetes bacterium TaxID=157466 RepID=A0A6J4JYK3_9BACT|nr:Phosphoglycerate mutase [uncultured Armatimonadetes bacterium]
MHTDGKGRLILIRHTESAWNKLNVFTGWVDVPLSEAGREHALEVGRGLRGKFDVDKAYTSSLVRAQETLDLVMEGANITGIPVVQDWHLNERFYGNWQSKNKKQTADKYGEDAVHAVRRGYAARPPGGESLEDTTDRVLPYFEETIEPEVAQGMVILIAAHGNSLRALAKKLDKLSDEAVPGFEIANGEVLVYRYDGDDNYVRERDAVNQ